MRLILALLLSLMSSAALAQGCGNTNPNCIIPYTIPGGLPTTIQSHLNQIPLLTDYASISAAYSAAQPGTIIIPAPASTMPYPIGSGSYNEPGVLWIGMGSHMGFGTFTETGTDFQTNYLFLDQQQNAPPSGSTQYTTVAIEGRPKGTGTDPNSDMGLIISEIKQNYTSTTQDGALTGLYIVTRQGGSTNNKNDSSGINVNTSVTSNGPAICADNAYESATSVFSVGGTELRGVHNQIGQISTNCLNTYGYVVQSDNNLTVTYGFFAQPTTGGTISNPFHYDDAPAGGSHSFNVDSSGNTTTSGYLVVGAATPTVGTGLVAFGNTSSAVATCGNLAGSVGCLVISSAGVLLHIPLF